MKLTSKLTTLMILFALLCAPSTLVFAQDEEEEKKPQAEKPEPEKPKKTKLDPNIFIGHGYDIMGRYAHKNSMRAPIFDLDEDEVKPTRNPESRYQEFSGKSLAEYQTNFSNELKIGGSYKIFSASVSVNFAKNDASSSAKEYMTIMNTVVRTRYQMPIDEESKVSATAQEAIDMLDATQLFTKYGTHYIWQADVGGRVDYNLTFNRGNSQKDTSVQVAAKAAINAVVGSVNIENETSFKNSIKKMEEAGTVKIEVYGGADNASAKVRANTGAIAEWADTVAANPTLAGFTDQSLKPIWLLAKTDERKQELKEAFDEWAKSKAIKEAEGKITFRAATKLVRVGENWYAKNSQNGPPYRIGVYSPVADPDNGWFVVGHAADVNNRPETKAIVNSILVKEVGVPSGTLLQAPLGYTEIYNDKSTGAKRDWSIWEAQCPVGFVALGNFAKYDHAAPNTNIPSENPFKDVRCISEGAVESAPVPTTANVIYDGQGSGGRNIMVYAIKPGGATGVNGNFFHTIIPGDYNDPVPTNVMVYVLKDPSKATEEPTRTRKRKP